MSWKVTAYGPRFVIEGALVAHEDAWDWDHEIVLSGREIAEDKPEEWQLEAWLDHEPQQKDKNAILALFENDQPELTVEKLPDTDWLVVSQEGLDPIRAGRFYIHTPEHPASLEPDVVNFSIPASQAFGTGQHATTAGCLAMLSHMKAQGLVVRNCADIGTGTGLLAFAALSLWPRVLATASDIDAVCVNVVEDNAQVNNISMGSGRGQLVMTIADGMNHPILETRGPYDLILANILAGPLVSLAPDFGKSLVPGGHLLLAGLLETQENAVRAACRKAGLRLAARMVNGDWSILWLRKRNR